MLENSYNKYEFVAKEKKKKEQTQEWKKWIAFCFEMMPLFLQIILALASTYMAMLIGIEH